MKRLLYTVKTEPDPESTESPEQLGEEGSEGQKETAQEVP